MFEYIEKCKKFEKLSTFNRYALLADKSLLVTSKLTELGFNVNESLSLIATFILGSIVSDGEVNEKEYLLMYPALLRTFGDNFDFDSIKEAFKNDFKTRKELKNYLKDILSLLNNVSNELKEDIVDICFAIVTIDGKLSLKERIYMRKLFSA